VTLTKALLAAALAAAVAAGAWALFLRSSDDEQERIWVGAIEDSVKQPDPAVADQQVALASQAGFDALNVTTSWEPGQTRPTEPELLVLRNVAAGAERRKIRLIVSVYHLRNRFTPVTPELRDEFAEHMASLARALPSVRYFAVANEPNLNGFWFPQFDESGQDIAAPTYTALLARAYDELKAVSPKINVLGGNLSPRGADNPESSRHTQSPTAFIRDMGRAYRASGRTKPLMDIFAIHPYLERSSIPPTRRHPIGTSIGIADYDKLVSLLGEAFDGTPQPGSELPIAYTEFGVQSTIPESAQQPYTNLQSPLGLDAVPERTQVDFYRQAVELAACQPNVVGLLFFHTRDEADLNRWQSGLYYADGKPKSSLPGIRQVAEQARRGELPACPD
jgi:hypothetical protein